MTLGIHYDPRLSVSFETSAEGNTALKTFTQDQTSPVVDLAFHRNLNTFTLAANTVLDTNTFTAEPSHLITIGNSICFLEGANFSQFNVLDVVANVITIDSPMDKVYTPSGTSIHHTFDMRFLGTAGSPGTYIIKPLPGQSWDITRVIFVIESTANNMDFTGFGSIAPLINGCVLRKKDGDRQNYFNWKTNGDFINRSFDHNFQSKTGGGGSGFTARSTFASPGRRGVAIRLTGDSGDELQVLVQDDLTGASLTKVFMIAQGHVVV